MLIRAATVLLKSSLVLDEAARGIKGKVIQEKPSGYIILHRRPLNLSENFQPKLISNNLAFKKAFAT